ncbi:MAG: hypothetical protein KGM98_11025, partial [Bacteroidota bacterium]|nr:hypothetical protein [Bacteroidota bacterium]
MLAAQAAVAQTPEIDSLKKLIATSTSDSLQVHQLLALSQAYAGIATDQSINYAFKARDLAL